MFHRNIDRPTPATRVAKNPLLVPPSHVAEDRSTLRHVPALIEDNPGAKPSGRQANEGITVRGHGQRARTATQRK
jgi:hypothetical protein